MSPGRTATRAAVAELIKMEELESDLVVVDGAVVPESALRGGLGEVWWWGWRILTLSSSFANDCLSGFDTKDLRPHSARL
jgi:hypothetical protein